jgi:hypothetical protein
LRDFEAQVAGIGPALRWSTEVAGRPVGVIAKWLHEFDAFRGSHTERVVRRAPCPVLAVPSA